MRTGSPSGVSPYRLLISIIVMVVVTFGIGLALHILQIRQSAAASAGSRKDISSAPKPSGAPASAIVATGDWVGFHNGGALVGTAEPIHAPPMKVRWSIRLADLTPLDAPTTAPATLPATSPATNPTTSPAVAPAYHAPGHFEAGPAIVAGIAYIADTAGAVRAISIADGKVKWTFTGDDGFETTPLVVNGRVFIGDLSGMFYALSADTGKKLWNFDDGGNSIHASANYIGPNREHILFATDGADIFCFDAASGKQIWNAKAGDRVNGVPAVANGSALVSGCDAQLRALKGTDGSEEFTADLGAVCPGSTAVSGDNLVLGTDQGRVLCISAKTHQQLWLFEAVGEHAMVYSSPAIADGIVVFGARDSDVYGLNLADGKLIWSFPTRGDVDSSPVISGGRVYIGSKDKKLYVLDLKTGKEIWSFTAGRGIAASPAIGNGVLLIADEGGHLFCLE